MLLWPLAVGCWQVIIEDMRDFRKYEIWQNGVEIADRIYDICDKFPKYEMFALADQLRRASVSIASNIAEGASRKSALEFAHYLEISIGSCFEVETQLQIAQRRKYITDEVYNELFEELQSEERQINTFISKLR